MNVELFIAIYGALLSTALLINELLKQRKKLTIILEHVTWYESVNVLITNSGHRPITLTAISIKVLIPDQDFWEPVPHTALFGVEQENDPFPITVKNGESISFPLGPVLTNDLIINRMKAKISIQDSEGKEYSEYKAREYDAKWGTYREISN